MRYAMVLICLFLVLGNIEAQNETRMISYSGVFKGEPLFVQNPYSPTTKSFCIEGVYVNNKRLDLNYNRSALLLNFQNVQEFSPVIIRISYSDSTCIPVLLNPDAIRYHSVFSFDKISISDSTITWSTRGEQENSTYTVEKYYFGTWEPIEDIVSKEVYGGSSYVYNPLYEDGSNKFRIKYQNGDEVLYSYEVEHVLYPEPVTFKREGSLIVLSRSSDYLVEDMDNHEVLSGTGKEFDISSLKNGQYYFFFGEEQIELYRKNDPVVVDRRDKSNN